MTGDAQPKPLKDAARITMLLDAAFGADRSDRGPVDIEHVALSLSKDISPDGLIHEVIDRDILGCMGALLYSESHPRQWRIVCHAGQSSGRRAFTVAHESIISSSIAL